MPSWYTDSGPLNLARYIGTVVPIPPLFTVWKVVSYPLEYFSTKCACALVKFRSGFWRGLHGPGVKLLQTGFNQAEQLIPNLARGYSSSSSRVAQNYSLLATQKPLSAGTESKSQGHWRKGMDLPGDSKCTHLPSESIGTFLVHSFIGNHIKKGIIHVTTMAAVVSIGNCRNHKMGR